MTFFSSARFRIILGGVLAAAMVVAACMVSRRWLEAASWRQAVFAACGCAFVGLSLLVVLEGALVRPLPRLPREIQALGCGRPFFARACLPLQEFAEAEEAVERVEGVLRQQGRWRGRERERVLAIQRRLMPGEDQWRLDCDLHLKYVAAAGFGGDAVATREIGDRKWMVLLADSTERGPAGTMTAVLVKAAFEVALVRATDPAAILTEMNRSLRESLDPTILVSALCARFDCADGSLLYASACGGPAFIARRDGGAVEHLPATGPILGFYRDAHIHTRQARLAGGDRLVIFTKGILAALDEEGRTFRVAELETVIRANGGRQADELAAAARRAWENHLGGRVPEDDFSMLVLDWKRS
ncbi:MAG: serine/threonine-protein phosphatase [Planctomycetota bacterium]|nr:serine/threonine-protein phosphatase [Planctomycetota bacterium]